MDSEELEWREELNKVIEKGKEFVFSQFEVRSLDDLLAFEKTYNSLSSELGVPFGDEWYDFNEGELSLLCKQPFHNNVGRKDAFYDLLAGYGLDEVEIVIIRSYLQQVSGMYRLDAYYYGIPPFVSELNRILQSALSKLPKVANRILVRQCRYNRLDFEVGEVFEPCYSLTTSANEEWNDGYGDQYVIRTLPEEKTKAHSLIFANDHERQVTFLVGARFSIDDVIEKKDGKTIYMSEIE